MNTFSISCRLMDGELIGSVCHLEMITSGQNHFCQQSIKFACLDLQRLGLLHQATLEHHQKHPRLSKLTLIEPGVLKHTPSVARTMLCLDWVSRCRLLVN